MSESTLLALVNTFGPLLALYPRAVIGGCGEEIGEGAQVEVFAAFADDGRSGFGTARGHSVSLPGRIDLAWLRPPVSLAFIRP